MGGADTDDVSAWETFKHDRLSTHFLGIWYAAELSTHYTMQVMQVAQIARLASHTTNVCQEKLKLTFEAVA